MLTGLTLVQKLVVVGFVLGVTLVYVRAVWVVCTWLLGKLARSPGPRRSRPVVWLDRAVGVLAVAGLACAAYAHFVEPYRIEVTHVTLRSAKLPTGAGPVRIAQISDLHCDPAVRAEDKLVRLVAEQRPDLIVFTGDAANSPAGVETFRRCMRQLARIAPVYGVRGNLDYPYGAANPLADCGLRELNAAAEDVEVKGAVIELLGFPDGSFPQADAIERERPNVFRVLLWHRPDAIEAVAGRGIDLYLAGHTHGGQVALPGYGALITLSRYGKRFERGLHTVRGTRLYVNRGIGMEGGLAPRVRFFARPEITVFEIVPE